MGLLVVAVFSDAVIPNLQEKLLRGLKMPLGEMVFLSNLGSFVVVLAYVGRRVSRDPRLVPRRETYSSL